MGGKTPEIYGSSDEYAIPLKNITTAYKDAIILVHDGEKEVSSSVGHSLMDSNPYAETRYKEAQENLSKILKSLREDDWSSAGEVIEAEALSLHGLMATSKPSFYPDET